MLDHGGWHEPKAGHFKALLGVSLIAAMPPPGGGRADVSARLLRHAHAIVVPALSEPELRAVIEPMVGAALRPLRRELQAMAAPLTSATLRVFHALRRELPPTPQRMLYAFTLRDLCRLVGGLQLAPSAALKHPPQLARLWLHEATRVFGDRLVSAADREWLEEYLAAETTTTLHCRFEQVITC